MATRAVMSKPSRNWDEADILSLITNGVPESINLDYKRSAALDKTDHRSKANISKDVSAFANSAGGTIVYGVCEDGQLPTEIDGGVDAADISKEWLENVINSTIQPRIDGIRINQVALSAHPGRVLYVVEIPQSVVAAPHQAHDHRYYKRFNVQSVPMEDYEVRDVMRRSIGPDLYCGIEIADVNSAEDWVTIWPFVGNHSHEPALYAYIDVYIDNLIYDLAYSAPFEQAEDATCTFGDFVTGTRHLYAPWVTPENPPIFRGVKHRIGDSAMTLTGVTFAASCHVGIVLKAPHMEPKSVVFQLHRSALVLRNVTRRDDLEFRVLNE